MQTNATTTIATAKNLSGNAQDSLPQRQADRSILPAAPGFSLPDYFEASAEGAKHLTLGRLMFEARAEGAKHLTLGRLIFEARAARP